MKNSPIGIFDSGIGGLTVAHALKEQMPNESIIYFGDTKHLPYGEKSEKSIINFSGEIALFLLQKKCKAIIIACNSSSSVAYNSIRRIAQINPRKISPTQSFNATVFNVIDPVVQYINNNCKDSIIGVIGTKATIKSNIYSKKIKKGNNNQEIRSLATPLLAPMIEEGFINGEISKTIISNYIRNPILKDIENLILACTHYPLIQKEIHQLYRNKVNVIDSVNIVAESISTSLQALNLLTDTKQSEYHFYVSNYTKSFEKSARFFFQEEIQLKEINPH